ncbi:MAG: RNA polymerase sigma factor [Rhodobacteraceae bacterium]|nr:RNA polymerase sigma factor [Paracoccaceae bacterium]
MGQAAADHLKAVWRFGLSLSGNLETADDLAQATMLRAMERAHQFNGGQLQGWLMTICRSIWLNELRRAQIRRTGALDSAEALSVEDINPGAEANIFAAEVFSKVMALPEAQRSTVELVYVQGFKYSEAARILDVPIGTVMSRLSAARATLAPLKSEDGPQQEKGRE